MNNLDKTTLLKNLKQVIRQIAFMKRFYKRTGALDNLEASQVEYNAIIKALVTRHNMTPEQIAQELTRKEGKNE